MPDKTKETYTHQNSPKKETPDYDKQIYMLEESHKKKKSNVTGDRGNYGVATISRLLTIVSLFSRISSLL